MKEGRLPLRYGPGCMAARNSLRMDSAPVGYVVPDGRAVRRWGSNDMQCWQCGRSVRQGAKLCIYCGAKLADDEEQEAPRASESRSGRRSSEQGGYRSAASRRDEDDLRDAPPYGESEEYAAYSPPDGRDGRRERASSHPRDDGDHPDKSVNYPRRESRPRNPMDDPRAPVERVRGTMPPSGRERREPSRYDDARHGAKDDPSGDGYRRGSREHIPEERSRRAARPAYDDEWGEGDPRSSRGSRREGRDGSVNYDSSRDYGRAGPPSSSSSRRRSDMEYDGGYDARGGRGDDYDERRERGASRSRHSGRDSQMQRDWERGDSRGQHGDARGAAYPQPPLDDSWRMPAVGGEPLDAWGVAPSEEMSVPMGARTGRGTRGGAAPARRGGKEQQSGGRVVLILLLVIIVIGLIGAGALFAPKLLGRFAGASTSGLDAQPPFTAYTPGPTPTAPPKYVEYVSQQLHFAIDYPKEWSKGESSADAGKTDWVATFTQPTPQAALLIEQSTGFDAIGNDEMIHDEVLAGQSDGSTFTETTTTPVHALIGGEQWLRRDFDVTTKAGTKLHMGILSCHHQGHGYIIVLVSLPQNFARDDQATFQSILSTFRFLV